MVFPDQSPAAGCARPATSPHRLRSEPGRAAGTAGTVAHPDRYQPPRLDRLGTLAELTQGGIIGPDDGFGGAGDDGSV